MRDSIRKTRARHLAWTLLAAALVAGTTGSLAAPECTMSRATIGEKDLSTPEISTEQMEVELAKQGALVIDARPYEEFAISHIPGAVNVSPKPGLPMSQYTSDVGEIGKLLGGDKTKPIVLYCNGPFCGKSKRVAADLVKEGYTSVVRYQLGIPVWRALGHPAQVEPEALWSTLDKDKTAVLIDAREPAGVPAAERLPGARTVRFEEVAKAKDDGRLPMLDHNTRIFVVGRDAAEALAAAQEIARNAFQNVSYYAGSATALLKSRPK
jgi:rhodanese-related sulfurtransferase